MSDETQGLLPWLAVLAVVGYGIYAVGVGAPYFGDDFQFVFEAPLSKVFYYFFHENPTNPLYRPLQSAYLALTQVFFGLNTAPIQLLQIAIHIGLAALIYRAMSGLGCSLVQARIASLWMLVSQANVHAVVSNDTLSQVGGTLFGCLSLWWLYRFCYDRRGGTGPPRLFFLSLGALALSLWSKESSISYVALLAAVVVIERWEAGGWRVISPGTVLRLAPIGLLSAAYLMVRSLVVNSQPHFGTDDYAFRLGSNVVANLALFGLGGLLPGNSVSLAIAAKSADQSRTALLLASALIVLAIIAYGIWWAKREQRVLVLILLCFAVTAMFPMALMNHVSELYVYNAIPFIVMLGGIAVGRLFEVWRSDRVRYWALACVCGLFFVSHGLAVFQKASMMKRQGVRAGQLLEQILPFAGQLPPGGRILLLNPPEVRPGYSTFTQSGFKVLRKGTHRIRALAGRDDISMDVVDTLPASKRSGPCLVLSLSDDAVTIDRRSPEICPLDNLAGDPHDAAGVNGPRVGGP